MLGSMCCADSVVGPSQRICSDAQVGVVEGIEEMTGAEVHTTTRVLNLGVEEFLRTGAGNVEQEQNKSRMHAELLAKRAKTPATKKSKPRPIPDATEIAAALQALVDTPQDHQSPAPISPNDGAASPGPNSGTFSTPRRSATRLPAEPVRDQAKTPAREDEPYVSEPDRRRRRDHPLLQVPKRVARAVTRKITAVAEERPPGWQGGIRRDVSKKTKDKPADPS
jgi:hypothetical protein